VSVCVGGVCVWVGGWVGVWVCVWVGGWVGRWACVGKWVWVGGWVFLAGCFVR